MENQLKSNPMFTISEYGSVFVRADKFRRSEIITAFDTGPSAANKVGRAPMGISCAR